MKRNVMSQCGPSLDFDDVEFYAGRFGPTRQFVFKHQSMVGQIEWDDDLDAPGGP